MNAQTASLIAYFSGEKQNVIPLFQRVYSWQLKDWRAYWSDLVDCVDRTDDRKPTVPHFLGAVVSAPVTSTPVGVSKFLVIDGQQRLTTTAILLAALRDQAAAIGDRRQADRLGDLLINRYESGQERLKVLPTLTDQPAFAAVVDPPQDDFGSQAEEAALPNIPKGSQVGPAYRFFREAVLRMIDDAVAVSDEVCGVDSQKTSDPPSENAVERTVKQVASEVVGRLSDSVRHNLHVVSIDLSADDDPYVIFESLNHKGQPLSQADLIRNTLLMRFEHDGPDGGRQREVYESYWRPIETLFEEVTTSKQTKAFSEFFRHYAMIDGKDVRQSGIYSAVKQRLEEVEAESRDGLNGELDRMRRAAVDYSHFLDPSREPDPVLQRVFGVLARLDTTIPYPLLLKLRELVRQGETSEKALVQIAEAIESFFVRRWACSVPTNALRRLFLIWTRHVRDVGTDDLIMQFAKGARSSRWPDDIEFADRLATDPQYGLKSTRTILERLERSYGHKEVVSFENATIEHVLPQTLTEEWREVIAAQSEDENPDEVHSEIVDQLGNLTLTAYNPELSNKPFSVKQPELQKSHYDLNSEIAAESVWGPEQIAERGRRLAEQVVLLYPRPETSESRPVDAADVRLHLRRNGSDAIGQYLGGKKIRVLAGSVVADEPYQSVSKSIENQRSRLIDDGTIVRGEGGTLRFARDHDFRSPSAAASVIVAGSSNGWEDWRAPNGQSLDALFRN